jgi:hypothetical protein
MVSRFADEAPRLCASGTALAAKSAQAEACATKTKTPIRRLAFPGTTRDIAQFVLWAKSYRLSRGKWGGISFAVETNANLG